MTFDVIIATCNRKESAAALIDQILSDKPAGLSQIIVVDASDLPEKAYYDSFMPCVYIHTSHKNQPYQRYLGYMLSKADWILYLDDDMRLMEHGFINDINSILMQRPDVVGFNIGFTNQNSFLDNAPISVFKKFQNNAFYRTIKWLTAYPQLKPNEYGYFGNRGARVAGKNIQYISGGAFFVKHDKLYQNFNMQLFDVYEHGLGKGEDGILGFALSKQGPIVAFGEAVLLHEDFKDSGYTRNHYLFNKRVAFSRYYLALEYQRLNNRSTYLIPLLYHWYCFFRLLGIIFNLLIHPSKVRLSALKGWLAGWRNTLFFRYDKNLLKNEYWKYEAQKEINCILNT